MTKIHPPPQPTNPVPKMYWVSDDVCVRISLIDIVMVGEVAGATAHDPRMWVMKLFNYEEPDESSLAQVVFDTRQDALDNARNLVNLINLQEN